MQGLKVNALQPFSGGKQHEENCGLQTITGNLSVSEQPVVFPKIVGYNFISL